MRIRSRLNVAAINIREINEQHLLFILYMTKCAMHVFHEKDKCMENTWFLANYNEEKTMRLSKRMENARGTFGHIHSKNYSTF